MASYTHLALANSEAAPVTLSELDFQEYLQRIGSAQQEALAENTKNTTWNISEVIQVLMQPEYIPSKQVL